MAKRQTKNKKINRKKTDVVDLIDRRDAPGVMFRPSTLDETNRSIEVVAATEAPALVYDPQLYEVVEEVLLMSGAEFPDKVPMTVEHERNASAVIGSFRDIRIEKGEMVGRVYFSSSTDSEPYYIKTKEQHLDRFSVTYEAGSRKSVWLAEGERRSIDGQIFEGPLLVTKKWKLRSLGLVIYGADEKAKARSQKEQKQQTKEIVKMDPKLRAFLERSGLKTDATEAEAYAFMDKLDVKREEVKPEKKVDPEPKVDSDEMVRAAIVAESERSTEIGAMCDRFEVPEDDKKKMIVDTKMTVEMARKAVLMHVEKNKVDP